MDWNSIDWAAVERLRGRFLDGTAGEGDYWRSESDLATYDQTFGARIGWKWDFVLGELKRRGWSPPAAEALDWGCGPGVAGRALLRHFGPDCVTALGLWDRSPLAMKFAVARVREESPGAAVRAAAADQATAGTLLLSHVLTELTDEQLSSLVAQAAKAAAVIWIEPGTHEVSRRLVDVRQRLLDRFQVVAPCTHQQTCGMLAPGNERHWCHHFAPSPACIHTDGDWVRFGRLAGIDLRSLPLSYLVLDRRPAPPLPADTVRLIGRPRTYKAYAQCFACDASGVRERRLMKRHCPEAFRQARRDRLDSLQNWRCDGDDVLESR